MLRFMENRSPWSLETNRTIRSNLRKVNKTPRQEGNSFDCFPCLPIIKAIVSLSAWLPNTFKCLNSAQCKQYFHLVGYCLATFLFWCCLTLTPLIFFFFKHIRHTEKYKKPLIFKRVLNPFLHRAPTYYVPSTMVVTGDTKVSHRWGQTAKQISVIMFIHSRMCLIQIWRISP